MSNYSYGISGSNNGQIVGISDNVDNGRSVAYSYDALYRLTNASTTGSTNYPAWGLSMTYDRYGNRSDETQTADSPPSNHVTIDAAHNRISTSGYAYDSSGNMTNDGLNTIAYDAENRAVSSSGSLGSGSYTYDGKGLRIKKISGSTTTIYIFSGPKVIAEYDNGAAVTAPSREYIYSGGALLAKIDSTGTKYYHQDRLSNRLVTDSNGNTVAQLGHYPFGESWYNATNDKLSFTSYERDSESGNDYSMARFDVSRIGRFLTPDPIAGNTADPQTLNRYSYTHNDPINLTDPSGMFIAPQLYALMHEMHANMIGSLYNQFDLYTTWGCDSSGEHCGYFINFDALSLLAIIQSKVPLNEKSLRKYRKSQEAAKKGLKNKKCRDFLATHGIDPDGLAKAIDAQVPYDGTKSNITIYDAGVYDPDDPQNQNPAVIDEFKKTTVSSQFKQTNSYSTVNGLSQTYGNDAYYRPVGFLGLGGPSPGDVFHEALHNYTHEGDHCLAEMLGIPKGESADINPVLAANDCI